MDNRLWKGEGIYINKLEPPPIYWRGFKYYSIRDVFILVERLYLASHDKMGLWLMLRKILIPEGN